MYEHENIGQNYRLPELLGAVGLSACENLPVMIERKRNIHTWYQELLGDIPFIKFQKSKPLDEPVWWLNALLVLYLFRILFVRKMNQSTSFESRIRMIEFVHSQEEL